SGWRRRPAGAAAASARGHRRRGSAACTEPEASGSRPPAAALSAELRAQELVHGPRVGLALRLAHHQADEEAEQALLAGAVGRYLAGVLGQGPVDERLE